MAEPRSREGRARAELALVLITHVDPDADLGGVEQGLEHLGFAVDPNEDGWRWRGPIDGIPVRLEQTFAAPATWPVTSRGRS